MRVGHFLKINIVGVCTDLSGNNKNYQKKPHRQAGVNRVMASGSLGGFMVSTLAWHAGGVGFNPPLGPVFPFFITTMTLVSVTRILYNVCAV